MKTILLATIFAALCFPALAREWDRPVIIASAYRVILGRDADRGGFCGWMEFDGSFSDLEGFFVRSDEYYLSYGDPKVPHAYRLMYHNAFGRWPNKATIEKLLENPHGVFHAIISSKEYEAVAKTLRIPCCGKNCK